MNVIARSTLRLLAPLFCAALVGGACGSDKPTFTTAPVDDAGPDDAPVSDGASADRPRGLCDPMDVQSDGPQCVNPGFSRFAWFGGACSGFACRNCAGADCDNLFITASGCDDAHIACYAVSGARRNCTMDSDCALASRTCCPCGTLGADDLIGVGMSEVNALKAAVCRGSAACVACVSTMDPAVRASCVSGRCQAVRAP